MYTPFVLHMHITFRQLKIFESVARQLSFTRASEELHLTQPAVSMQIKQLEQAVGLPLFEQVGKKIFLTDAGREFSRYATAITSQLDELDQVLVVADRAAAQAVLGAMTLFQAALDRHRRTSSGCSGVSVVLFSSRLVSISFASE